MGPMLKPLPALNEVPQVVELAHGGLRGNGIIPKIIFTGALFKLRDTPGFIGYVKDAP
jgi:hypothetical protein